MNEKICPQCGAANPVSMSFCTNCGQNLIAAGDKPSDASQEPPPTVFMGQTAPPKSPPQFEQPAPVSVPAAKKGKGWIFAVAGCLGLLILSVIGLGVIALVLGYGNVLSENGSDKPAPTPFSNTKTTENTKSKTTDSSNTAITENQTDDADTGSFLVTILEGRKQVGSFNQTSAKSLVTEDYFPLASGAAQAEYADNSKYVYLTVGKFASLAVAEENFEDQLEGVKSSGGKVTYQNTASDGTISALYNNKGFYFAEYCNTNGFCNRIHSNNQAALKSFFESYAK